ncbi:MAG TPA: serine hydrolase [Labilithrix sp.]
MKRFFALALLVACGSAPSAVAPAPPRATSSDVSSSFGEATPESQGVDPAKLAGLARKIASEPEAPIFSLLVSRHGKLVFELYTSGIQRDDAHYVMSVTKTFTSTLVGIAIDRGLLSGPDETIADALPREAFPSDADVERFRKLTIRDVLAMSALDAPVAPHQQTPEAKARIHAFMQAPNRTTFALGQPLLGEPGKDFLYTDVTPAIATGILAYRSHVAPFDFAEENLFRPLGFRNVEWMHVDRTGIDNGAFGLRVRPIDMQKLGVLFLRGGEWDGKRILSRAMVDLAFTPSIASKPEIAPNYGWYWWTRRYGPKWVAHCALGWKGQVIAVFPEQDLVVTMTAAFEGGIENKVFDGIVEKWIVPAIASTTPAPSADLAPALEEVRRGPSRFAATLEHRMVPSASPKEQRRAMVRLP